MSKKRPGVSSAIRLAKSTSVELWESVESQFEDLLTQMDKDSSPLSTHQKQLDILGPKLLDKSKKSLTKSELLEVIVPWKFAVGKARPALWKHLRSNPETTVKACSEAAILQAQKIGDGGEEDDIKSAMQAVTALKGVGPATASALLTLVRPDTFCYMYDEVIDCFLPNRRYTLPMYLDCNLKCFGIAVTLNEDSKNESWTAARVARTLWIAARVSASGTKMTDHTLKIPTQEEEDQDTPKRQREEEEDQDTVHAVSKKAVRASK